MSTPQLLKRAHVQTVLAPTASRDHSRFDGIRFPNAFVCEMARMEAHNRHLYRPAAYFHKWWARRCGTTFRSILKHLGSQVVGSATDYYDNDGLRGLTVLDPMAGGGTTAYEAVRLGARAIAVDIDPVAATLIRAGLRPVAIQGLNLAWNQWIAGVQRVCAPYWDAPCATCGKKAEVQYTLHGRIRRDGRRTTLWMDDPVLREEEGGSIVICPECWEPHRTRDEHKCSSKADFTLQFRQEANDTGEELSDRPYSKRFFPVVDRVSCPDCGYNFQRSNPAKELQGETGPYVPEEFLIPDGPKSADLLRMNVKSFLETFTARQLRFLEIAEHNLKAVPVEYRFHMGMLLSTALEFNSMLCGYKGAGKRRPGAVRHVFAHHAYSIPWTALENNPVYSKPASGNLWLLYQDRLIRGLEWRDKPRERLDGHWHYVEEQQACQLARDVSEFRDGVGQALVINQDGRLIGLENEIDIVVTDPPYFDSVQYSDLSWFFRVWLRRFLPEEADWELSAHKSMSAASLTDRSFSDVLGAVFRASHLALRPGGKLAFTYHHWRPEAWAELTRALRIGGFRMSEYHVVHAENPQSVHISGLRALTHDAILVFSRTSDPTEYMGSRNTYPEDDSDSAAFVKSCAEILGKALASPDVEDLSDLRHFWETEIGGGLVR